MFGIEKRFYCTSPQLNIAGDLPHTIFIHLKQIIMENVFFYSLSFNAKLHKDKKNNPDGSPVSIVVTDEPVEISKAEVFGQVLTYSNKRSLQYGMIPLTLPNGKPIRSHSPIFKKMQEEAGYNAKNGTYKQLGQLLEGWIMDPDRPVLNTETQQPNGMLWCVPA